MGQQSSKQTDERQIDEPDKRQLIDPKKLNYDKMIKLENKKHNMLLSQESERSDIDLEIAERLYLDNLDNVNILILDSNGKPDYLTWEVNVYSNLEKKYDDYPSQFLVKLFKKNEKNVDDENERHEKELYLIKEGLCLKID
jgi:hypothetical protein